MVSFSKGAYMLRYCSKCVMPSTKPDLLLDKDGVCNACRSYEKRELIDWELRKKELLNIVEQYRNNSSESWDCIVPVSGGKDSTYQVIKMLQMGLNPLCVTSTTCDLSEVGRRNIENIKGLGVDHIEISPKPNIRAKLNRIGLEQVGDISWPEHVGIFTIPVRAAVQFNVPLIVWGENSQNEYGGPAAASDNHILSRAWLEEFGGLLGMRVSDLTEQYGIKSGDLINYRYPTDLQLKQVGVTGLFLGHYIPWDGLSNALIAQANGFICNEKAVEGSMVNYENLDNYQTGIHDYFKFLKFGFSRASDLASLHIRRGRITREDGLDIVRRLDGKFPWKYLGKSLRDILLPLDLTVDEFILIADKFTNKKIFERSKAGDFIKDNYGNLRKIDE